MTDRQTIIDNVKSRYGQIARASTPSCCGGGGCATEASDISLGYKPEELGAIPKGASMSLGCGNPTSVADLKPGEVVLDLGSGGGVDCFLAAKKVGDRGFVIGVDMTEEMIDLARHNAKTGGYSNVSFRLGEIEELPVDTGTIDAIISNCVINLAPDKTRVFKEMFRVLRPGGRFSVSDVVAKGAIPLNVRKNMEQWAGCISGALDKNDYLQKVADAGFERIEIRSEVDYDFQRTDDFSLASVTVVGYKPLNHHPR
ncbi:MAG: arsenite methyltransferase [candidate division Zixibacteria bacterium]|nr:arsenite methyltransferase [candidate division Zixibacteria bacterium]